MLQFKSSIRNPTTATDTPVGGLGATEVDASGLEGFKFRIEWDHTLLSPSLNSLMRLHEAQNRCLQPQNGRVHLIYSGNNDFERLTTSIGG
ncbi:MAG: hypothetical protein OXE59_03060 [Bacteroidetes bacterium]|nr:hypothetical protein [Bacteroidota bacterium]MCY4232710.1 hypothetical protein [Bacteroidota bacterium]